MYETVASGAQHDTCCSSALPERLDAMLSADLIRNVLDSAPDAMLIVDGSGTILFANHQISAFFGYDAAEVQGRRVEMLLPDRFRSRHLQHRGNYASTVRVRAMGDGLELFALRKDGTEFPVEISLSPISDGGGPLVVAAIRDITDRRAIEVQLQEARKAADQANQAKSRFLATASHDLRQPVQTMALLNGAMRRIAKDPDLLEALEQGELAIGTMSRLLNALLDINKLEAGAITPAVADFSIAQVFGTLRAEFATVAAQKGLAFEIDASQDCARTDPTLVEQLLRNLVSNAIKYTHRGAIRLTCSRHDSVLRVTVADTGIGISKDALSQIFEEFFQVGITANTSREGYGLGLSIVRRIADLLGSGLQVHSELGKGSMFTVELPVGGVAVEDCAQEPGRFDLQSPRLNTQPHLLLVEDDPGVRNATRMLLKAEGYRVSVAASSAEALHLAAGDSDIDLLVTDYHLGGDDTGLQVIESLRRQLKSDLPVVLITGDTSSLVQNLARDTRLRITSKPVNADELMSLLRELIVT